MQEQGYWHGRLILLAAVLGGGSAWAAAIPGPSTGGAAPLPNVPARLTWRVALPLRSIDFIKSCHLVEGYLYAITSESVVHCVRADTGRLLWSRQLAAPRTTVYPPVAYRSPEFYAVAFTLSSEVVFLDPETGSEYKRLRLLSPASASCSTAPGLVFSTETNSRLRAYDMKDGLLAWQLMGEGPFSVAPVYQPDLETVVFTDNSGLLGMVWGTDKEEVYVRSLPGAAVGSVECDGKNFYVATTDQLVNCVDRVKGNVTWQHRLPAKPQGGPVICGTSLYQAVGSRGIQHISLGGGQPDWFAPDAVKFLCDWGGRPALLLGDGRVATVDPATGRPTAFIETGPVAGAVSNSVNDALLLFSPAGEVRCLQPMNASPTVLASFRPPTTQPTTQPAIDQATSRPALVRKEKPDTDNPLWARSTGSTQGTGQANAGGSSRRERSSRSGSRDRSSSRGSRGSRSGRGDSDRGGGRSGRGGSRGSRGGRGGRGGGGFGY